MSTLPSVIMLRKSFQSLCTRKRIPVTATPDLIPLQDDWFSTQSVHWERSTTRYSCTMFMHNWFSTSTYIQHLFEGSHLFVINSLWCMGVNGEALQLHAVYKSHILYYKSSKSPYQYYKSCENLLQYQYCKSCENLYQNTAGPMVTILQIAIVHSNLLPNCSLPRWTFYLFYHNRGILYYRSISSSALYI